MARRLNNRMPIFVEIIQFSERICIDLWIGPERITRFDGKGRAMRMIRPGVGTAPQEHESTLLASDPLLMRSVIFHALVVRQTRLYGVLVWISQGLLAN